MNRNLSNKICCTTIYYDNSTSNVSNSRWNGWWREAQVNDVGGSQSSRIKKIPCILSITNISTYYKKRMLDLI